VIKEQTTPVLLKYAYWLIADERIDAGTIIDLPLDKAKALIAAGKAERADSFPGEK
jgi:hypothetical protein